MSLANTPTLAAERDLSSPALSRPVAKDVHLFTVRSDEGRRYAGIALAVGAEDGRLGPWLRLFAPRWGCPVCGSLACSGCGGRP